MIAGNLKQFLERKVDEFNQPSFIKDDPISIPHLFSNKQDIEIAGFFAAVFSWGNRTTIIQKTKELMQLMDMSPYGFCQNYNNKNAKKLKGFKHRTFTEDDLFYFIQKTLRAVDDALRPVYDWKIAELIVCIVRVKLCKIINVHGFARQEHLADQLAVYTFSLC